MAIISQETWDKMPEEEKEKIRTDYHNYKVLLDALKDGSLDRKQVEINATRVYRMAEKLV